MEVRSDLRHLAQLVPIARARHALPHAGSTWASLWFIGWEVGGPRASPYCLHGPGESKRGSLQTEREAHAAPDARELMAEWNRQPSTDKADSEEFCRILLLGFALRRKTHVSKKRARDARSPPIQRSCKDGRQ